MWSSEDIVVCSYVCKSGSIGQYGKPLMAIITFHLYEIIGRGFNIEASVTSMSVDTSIYMSVDATKIEKGEKLQMNMNTNPQTNTQAMPITPNHQQLIDDVLQLVLAHVNELAPAIGYSAPQPLPLDQMRTSLLAKELRVIARYSEGYDLGTGSILPIIQHVARLLYPKPMSTSGNHLPPNFHQSSLGEMVNDALARYFPREHRMTVGEVTKLLDVTRQTIHDWANDDTLMPIYDRGTLTFQRKQVEDLQRRRAARKKSRNV